MSTEVAVCALCGEPMPAGEEMFKYHGFSGPCPKPPKQYSYDTECGAIADPWTGKGPYELLGGFKVVNKRTVTLAQYRAELNAAAARAKAIHAANIKGTAR